MNILGLKQRISVGKKKKGSVVQFFKDILRFSKSGIEEVK